MQMVRPLLTPMRKSESRTQLGQQANAHIDVD